MRIEVELLKDEPDLSSQGVDIGFRVGEIHAIDDQTSLVDRFQLVDGPYQGRFSGTGRPADNQNLALGNMQLDIVKYMQVFIPFVHTLECDHHNSLLLDL